MGLATSPRHVTAYLPFTLLCLLLPTEQTAKMLRTKTVRRLFRMEDQPMVKLVNTAGDASKNNGIRAMGAQTCNPAIHILDCVLCPCIQSINQSITPSLILSESPNLPNTGFSRCGHLEGCKTGKDSISFIQAWGMGMDPRKGLSIRRNSFMGLEGTRSPSTVDMAESRNNSSGEQVEALCVLQISGPWCSRAIRPLANDMASPLSKSPSP